VKRLIDMDLFVSFFVISIYLSILAYSVISFIKDSSWIKKRRARKYRGHFQEQLREIESLPATTLLEKIKEKDDSAQSLSLRLKAIRLLGDTGDFRAVEPLIHLLGEVNPNIRGAVVAALGNLGDLRAVQPLIKVLENDVMGARLTAIEALGDLGDPRAIEPLIHAFEYEPLIHVFGDNDVEVQLLIVEALRKIHDPRVGEFFIHILQNKNPAIRMTAVKILEQIGDVQAIKPLVSLLKDNNSTIRLQALKALDKMHWKPENITEKTLYVLVKKDWDSFISLGSAAIEPLMKIVLGRISGLRKDAETALQTVYALIEVVIFGSVEIKNFAPRTTLLNPDVSTVAMPMSALEKIGIYAESYDFHQVERFITYAVNYIGQERLKEHVEVHIYGDTDKLHPNLRNSLENLCKCVEVHQ
jgi:hypothetical protein